MIFGSFMNRGLAGCISPTDKAFKDLKNRLECFELLSIVQTDMRIALAAAIWVIILRLFSLTPSALTIKSNNPLELLRRSMISVSLNLLDDNKEFEVKCYLSNHQTK